MTASLASLARYVHQDRAIARVQDMVRIPSVAGEERPMAEYVANSLRELGCQTVHVDAEWNVLGVLDGAPGDQSLLLHTHTDGAPAGEMADPYSGALRDGTELGKSGSVVWGRGACAPDGATAAMLEAIAALREARFPIRGRLMVAAVTKGLRANSDGTREIHRLVQLAAQHFVVAEPTDNRIALGARGMTHLEVVFEGKAAHRGRPTEAANPLYALGEMLASLKLATLPNHPALGPATVSPFDVRADSIPPLTPHRVSLVVDRRLLPGESPVDAQRGLENELGQILRRHPGVSGQVQHVRAMYPYSVSESAPTVRLVQEAAAAVFGGPLDTTYLSFGTNAGYLMTEVGLDGVVLGPGRIEDVHETEHVEVSSVHRAAVLYAAIAARALT